MIELPEDFADFDIETVTNVADAKLAVNYVNDKIAHMSAGMELAKASGNHKWIIGLGFKTNKARQVARALYDIINDAKRDKFTAIYMKVCEERLDEATKKSLIDEVHYRLNCEIDPELAAKAREDQ
jgi:hypothetical protein